jgi:hypothetical protein
MSDNPALDDDPGYYNMICGLYPKGSLQYRRNVLGEWAQAEGLIYDCFSEKNQCHRWELPLLFNKKYIGIDYGTKNSCVFLLIGTVQQVSGPDHYYIIKAYYYSGRKTGITKTSGEYKDDLIAFIGHHKIDGVFCDPEAAHFVAELTQAGLPMEKVNNSVGPGIQTCMNLFYAGLLTVCKEDCEPLIEELNLYSYADNNLKDLPKKENDHCVPGETLVETENGPVPILDLVGKQGRVCCFDELNQEVTLSEFSDVRLTRESVGIYELETLDGRTLRATADHLILTTAGWKPLKYVTDDDIIVDAHTHLLIQ